jgi:zinc protease
MQRYLSFFCILIILAIQPAIFGKSDRTIEKLPNGVSMHSLDNGIKVLLIENPILPMIGVNTVVKVGSAYETFATSGMSHMLEHLLFNGTDTMTQKELYDAADRIGGYNNASTSEYYTNYMMVTPSENIEEGIKIQSGMLFHSILPEDKFEKEKGIVLEEIAKSLAKSVEQEERNITSIIYNGHALSLPTLGTYETIKQMDRDDVNNFYKNYYVPNNMVMSVIGNFKSGQMLKLLKKYYGSKKPGNVESPVYSGLSIGFEELKSKTTNGNNIFHRFYTGDKTKLQLFFNVPSNSDEYFSLLSLKLDKHENKLQEIVEAKFPGAVKGIEFTFRNYSIVNYIQATLTLNNESQMNDVMNLFQSELDKLKFNLSKEVVETESIKSQTSFLKNIEKPHMFGIYNAGAIAEYGLGSIISAYSGKEYGSAAKLVEGFTFSSDPLIIIQHPSESSSEDKVTSEVKTELFNSEKNRPVIIARQNSASSLLAIHYMINNKAALELRYGKDAAKLWHDAFGQRMKSDKNLKESMQFGFSFTVNDNPYIPMDNIYLNPEFGYIRAEGLGDDIKGAIDYLNKEMLNFVPTEEEFSEALKNTGKSHMMMGKDKSKELYNKTYESIIYEPTEETNDAVKITYDKLLTFGKEYFIPSNMIISIVSSAEPSEINEYFSAFNSKADYLQREGTAHQRAYSTITNPEKFEHDGGGEQSHLFYGFIKSINKEDIAALTALSLLLRENIIFDIREKQGLAYRMSAGIDIRKDKALFYVKLPTRPSNVDKLVPQFPGFFYPEFADNIKDEDLTKSINMYLGRMMFRRLSSVNQAYYLGYSYNFYNNIYEDEQSLKNLKNVTLDQVKGVANKYLQIENPIEIIIR